MESMLIFGLVIFVGIAIYQQMRIKEMENSTYTALKKTCETLDVIKNGLTISEIIKLREDFEKQHK